MESDRTQDESTVTILTSFGVSAIVLLVINTLALVLPLAGTAMQTHSFTQWLMAVISRWDILLILGFGYVVVIYLAQMGIVVQVSCKSISSYRLNGKVTVRWEDVSEIRSTAIEHCENKPTLIKASAIEIVAGDRIVRLNGPQTWPKNKRSEAGRIIDSIAANPEVRVIRKRWM
jgi:hypothetical protein